MKKLIIDIFANLEIKNLHSISIGELRFPKQMYDKIVNLYPEEKLLSKDLVTRGDIVSYPVKTEQALQNFILAKLSLYVKQSKIFSCKS